jgi:hypothetical protein
MSKEKDNPYVSVGTCKIVTDSLNEKIAAQKMLVDAEIKAIKMSIYSSVTTLGIILSVLTLVLKFWRP